MYHGGLEEADDVRATVVGVESARVDGELGTVVQRDGAGLAAARLERLEGRVLEEGGTDGDLHDAGEAAAEGGVHAVCTGECG